MVSIPPENLKLTIDCPDCGKRSIQSVTRLRRYKHFRCKGCGQTVVMRGNQIDRLEGAVAEFEREIEKIEFFVNQSP